MKKLILLIFTCSFGLKIHAQQTQWIKSNPIHYSMNPGLVMQVVKTSNNGNIISSRVDSSTVIYGQDVFGKVIVECQDLNAAILWSYTLSDSVAVHHIQTDANDDIYIAGTFLGTVNLNNNDTINNIFSGQFSNCEFIIKLSSSGSLLWKFNATVNQTYPSISTITCDQQNNFWYCTTNFLDCRMYKMDSNGMVVDSVLSNNNKSISDIVFDSFGAAYICGATEQGVMTINADSFTVTDSYNMYIARLNSSLKVDWIQFGHDVTFQSPQLKSDGSGGVFFAGNLMDSVSWGNINFPHPQWTFDFFLTRVDSAGNFIWGRHFPVTPTITGNFAINSTGKFLDTDAGNNIFLLGTLNGSVDWGNGAAQQGTLGQDKLSLVSFDKNNTVLWQKTAKTLPNFPTGISISNTNDIYLTAAVTDTCTIDSITVNAGGALASIVVKISTSTSGINNIALNTINVYPNPATSFVNLPHEWNEKRIDIIDLNGRVVKSVNLQESKLNIEAFRSGIYFLRCENQVSRLIITE
jgi:hypothetical protein